jgi:hypothetical protein
MAIDPTIPLGIKPVGQADPFNMIAQWAQIQNAVNQNRLFQQTFAARQMAGQILSNAPDLETGLQSLMTNPVTAPFAAETINAVRQGQATMVQLQGQVQTQAKEGLDGFVKMLGPVYADPTEDTWNNTADAILSTLSPLARQHAAPAIDSLRKSLLDGLPQDPAQRKATFNQRIVGLMLAGGMSPDAIKALSGTPGTLDLGGAIQPTITAPPQLGGGIFPTGPGYGKTLAPQIAPGPGGVGIPVGGSNNLLGPVPAPGDASGTPANPLSPAAATAPTAARPNPLTPAELSDIHNTITGGPAAPAQPAGLIPPAGRIGPNAGPARPPDGAAAPEGISPVPRDAAGNAVFPASQMTAPQVARGIANLPLLSPGQLKQNEKLQDEFAGDGAKEYTNAVQSLASLRYMENALDEAAKKTGSFTDRFLTPGAFAETRANIAQTYNTLAAMAGTWDPTKPEGPDNKAPFSPNTIASLEDFQKETKRMGLMVLTTFLGAQREAAQTIQGITASVPGISNTYLGGKLVADSIRGAMQRVVDRRQFMNQWANSNQGDLRGAAEKFDSLYPAEQYADRVLGKYGLLESGFRTPNDLINAVRQGWISPSDGAAIGRKQFPSGPQ